MSEAPNLPAGAQGQGNDPGPAVPQNAHAPTAPNALAPLNIPPAANAPPQPITIGAFKVAINWPIIEFINIAIN